MKTTKYNQGFAAIWIILATIVVLGAGGYIFYLKSNQTQNTPQVSNVDFNSTDQSTAQPVTVPTEQAPQTQPPVTSVQSDTVNTKTPNASNLTCNQIFPSDIAEKVFPSPTASVKGGYTKGVALFCSYTLLKPKTPTAGAIVSVIISDLSVNNYDAIVSDGESAIKGFSTPVCVTTNNIGSKSRECTYTIKSVYENDDFNTITFVSSNNKYVTSVTISQQVPLIASDQEGIILQMAKEVDSKLSSY